MQSVEPKLSEKDQKRVDAIRARMASTTFEPEREACRRALDHILKAYTQEDLFTSTVNELADEVFVYVLDALDLLQIDSLEDLSHEFTWIDAHKKATDFTTFDSSRQFNNYNWALKRYKQLREIEEDKLNSTITVGFEFEDDGYEYEGLYDDESLSFGIPWRVPVTKTMRELLYDAAVRLIYAFKLYHSKNVV